jgi:hypothetical protein
LVESCFELSAKTLFQQADNNNRVVLPLKNEKRFNNEKAQLTLTVKPALPNSITSLTDAFSKQLSERRNTEQFLNDKNDWAVFYNLDHPSHTDKAGTIKFPFPNATQIVLHSHLLTDNQWVLPNRQLIGFIKDWILSKDSEATIWLRKHNQLLAAFALADLTQNMATPPENISNAKIYFSQNPPNGIENPWLIPKTRFFEATLKWLQTQDNNALLTFKYKRRYWLMNTLPVDFNGKNWPAQLLTVSIPTGLDFNSLKKLAAVKISRGPYSQQYALSKTIELPRGQYPLNQFTIDVVYDKPWVTHLLNETVTGETITIDSQTNLPKLTITSPDSQISDADWKKYCHLEQPQDANRLFKALSDGQAKVDCYPLLVKNAVAKVHFRKTGRQLEKVLSGSWKKTFHSVMASRFSKRRWALYLVLNSTKP